MSHGFWIVIDSIAAIATLGHGVITFLTGDYPLAIWQLTAGGLFGLAALHVAEIRELEERR